MIREWIAERGPLEPITIAAVGDYDEALRLELARRLHNAELAAKDKDKRAAWMAICRRDFRVWRDNWCFVYDELRTEWVPYLSRPYQDELQAIYLGLDGWRSPDGELYVVANEKSRRVGATVGICGAAIWRWQFSPTPDLQTFVGLKLRALDDRSDTWGAHTFAKLRGIVSHQPKWMRPGAWATDRRRFVDRAATMINPINGASIKGVGADASAKAADSNRGGRSFRVWIDEAGRFQDLEQVAAVFGMDGPICYTGSIRPGSHFGDICAGRKMPKAEKGQNGIIVRRVHYSQNPDMDPTTEKGRLRIAGMRGRMTEAQIAVEMEMDETANQVGKILADAYNSAVCDVPASEARQVAAQFLGPHVRWIESWDFGNGTSPTVWLMTAFIPGSIPTLYLYQYRCWLTDSAATIASDVGAAGWLTGDNPQGVRPHLRVGDPSGLRRGKRFENGVQHHPVGSWIQNLGDYGINVSPTGIVIEDAIRTVRERLAAGQIRIMPGCAVRRSDQPSAMLPCPKEGIQQYQWGSRNKYGFEEPKKDNAANLADVVQFAVVAAWPSRVEAGASRKTRLSTPRGDWPER